MKVQKCNDDKKREEAAEEEKEHAANKNEISEFSHIICDDAHVVCGLCSINKHHESTHTLLTCHTATFIFD